MSKSTLFQIIDKLSPTLLKKTQSIGKHSDDILGVRMLWKPKEARILKNFIDQPL